MHEHPLITFKDGPAGRSTAGPSSPTPCCAPLSDLEIFEAALLEGRVIVTNNVPDFESLRRARDAAGGAIPGLIYTSDFTFRRTKAYVSRLVTALADAATGRETAWLGGVLWLHPPG